MPRFPKAHFSRSGTCERGASLVAILVGVAVIGIVALAMTQLLDNQTDRLAALRDTNDQRELRNYLNYAIHCGDTKAAAGGCSGVTTVDLIDKKGKTLVGKSGTAFGKWNVRAACVGNDIQVQVRSTKSQGTYVPLYKKIPFSCSL